MDNLDAGAEFFHLQDSVSCKAMRFNKDALVRCKVQGKNGYFPIANSVDSLLYNRLLQPEYIITLPFTRVLSRFWYRRPRNVNRRLLTRPEGPSLRPGGSNC